MPFVAGNGMLGIIDEEERIAFAPATSALIFDGYAALALAIGAHRSDP